MGCNTSVESTANLILKKECIDTIQSSWKYFSETNSLAEHGINMMIRLFITHPEVKPIWKFATELKTEDEMRQNGTLEYHGKRVMETIGVAVKSLANPDVLDILLVELGARHFTYGTKPEHFALIKEVFIYTFSNALKEKFTPEVLNAWDLTFKYIAKKMIEGMDECEALNNTKHS